MILIKKPGPKPPLQNAPEIFLVFSLLFDFFAGPGVPVETRPPVAILAILRSFYFSRDLIFLLVDVLEAFLLH